MTPALLDAPVRLFGEAGQPDAATGGRVTLEERLGSTWRALQAQGVAECPVCRARMTRVEQAGECTSCGSRLS
jgi:hypothetical protein